jgi:hypothetical protein
MHTHGFSCLSAYIYIYIYYTSTISVHFYHENTTPVHPTHSHIQHLALKYPPGHTHTAHTDSTACMTAHTHLFILFLLFHHSTIYIYISTTHIYNHSHFTRSVLSKQVQFISQHKHIIFLVLFCINIHILLPVLLCTYTYIYIQQIMLIIPPSKHLSTYILIMLFFYL